MAAPRSPKPSDLVRFRAPLQGFLLVSGLSAALHPVSIIIFTTHALVAQRIEHIFAKDEAPGSYPGRGTEKRLLMADVA